MSLSEPEIRQRFAAIETNANQHSEATLQLYELLEKQKARHDQLAERVLAVEKSNGKKGG